MTLEIESPPRADVDLSSHRDSLSRLVYEHIREEIVSGVWGPGAQISIRQEADRFRISPTPVREALLQLASEGALHLRRRAFVIPKLTADEFAEIRKIRVALEAMLAREAVTKPNPRLAQTLSTIHARLSMAKASGNFTTVMNANRHFHFRLYEEAQMPHAIAIVRSLWARTGPYQQGLYLGQALPDPQAHDHLQVIAAVRKGDSESTARAIVQDITLRGVQEERIANDLEYANR